MSFTASVRLQKVRIRYDRVTAIEDLSLEIPSGEIFGLLGPNGSGKSSILNAIAGIIDPVDGKIQIGSISRKENPFAYSGMVGLVPQEPALYEELSARDNLAFVGHLYGLSGRTLRKRIEELLDRFDLSHRGNDRLSTFSGGLFRRINLACALIHNPSVLLLDEPTVALDPPARELLFEILASLRDEGRVVIFTTHHLEEAEELCDRIGILRNGRLVTCGRLSEFQVTEQAIVLGQLREALADEVEHTVRNRLSKDVEFRIIGRRVRLKAPTGEQLGYALATLYSEGVIFDSFRTPSAQLEPYFFNEESPISLLSEPKGRLWDE
jgi:ABC-2 type transport system ATP-binding protein